MLWVKAFHIIFMVTWFAGLFYLPRLYVYHSQCEDKAGQARFRVMEKKLLAIMSIGAVLTVVFGLWLWLGYGITGGWMHAKLVLVLVLAAYHGVCFRINARFRAGENRMTHVQFRWFNELPAILLVLIVVLVVVKPF